MQVYVPSRDVMSWEEASRLLGRKDSSSDEAEDTEGRTSDAAIRRFQAAEASDNVDDAFWNKCGMISLCIGICAFVVVMGMVAAATIHDIRQGGPPDDYLHSDS